MSAVKNNNYRKHRNIEPIGISGIPFIHVFFPWLAKMPHVPGTRLALDSSRHNFHVWRRLHRLYRPPHPLRWLGMARSAQMALNVQGAAFWTWKTDELCHEPRWLGVINFKWPRTGSTSIDVSLWLCCVTVLLSLLTSLIQRFGHVIVAIRTRKTPSILQGFPFLEWSWEHSN